MKNAWKALLMSFVLTLGIICTICIISFPMGQFSHSEIGNLTISDTGFIICSNSDRNNICYIMCKNCNYSVLYPVNLPKAFRENHLHISFTAKVITINKTRQRVYAIIKIINISRLPLILNSHVVKIEEKPISVKPYENIKGFPNT